MDAVEAAGFFLGEAHGFDGDDFEASFMDARKNLALVTATDGVGLDDSEGAFEWHEKFLRSIELRPASCRGYKSGKKPRA